MELSCKCTYVVFHKAYVNCCNFDIDLNRYPTHGDKNYTEQSRLRQSRSFATFSIALWVYC